MPFLPHVVVTRSQQALGTGMAVSLKKLKEAPSQLHMTLRTAVAEQLGWKANDAIAVLVGEGDDRGLLRLKAEAGGTAQLAHRVAGTGRRGGPYFVLNLGHIPAFPGRSEEKRWVKFEIVEDGWVEVVLPRWADAPRPPPGAGGGPVPVSPAVSLAVARTGGQHLTSRMMGDPPASRSALNQRPEPPAPAKTRGEARRDAERREEPSFNEVERAEFEREISAADFLGRVMTCFGLTRTEGRYLIALMDGRLCTKERLLAAGHDESEDIELKSVDVYVHKLRAKLNTRLISIETVWAQGYQIDKMGIARLRRLLAEDAEKVAVA